MWLFEARGTTARTHIGNKICATRMTQCLEIDTKRENTVLKVKTRIKHYLYCEHEVGCNHTLLPYCFFTSFISVVSGLHNLSQIKLPCNNVCEKWRHYDKVMVQLWQQRKVMVHSLGRITRFILPRLHIRTMIHWKYLLKIVTHGT